MWTGAPALTSVFLSQSEPAWALAVYGLPILGVCALFFAPNITFIGYYQSREQAGLSIFYMLLRGVIFVLPGFVFLPRLFGIAGLWLAIPATELLTLAVIGIVYLLRR